MRFFMELVEMIVDLYYAIEHKYKWRFISYLQDKSLDAQFFRNRVLRLSGIAYEQVCCKLSIMLSNGPVVDDVVIHYINEFGERSEMTFEVFPMSLTRAMGAFSEMDADFLSRHFCEETFELMHGVPFEDGIHKLPECYFIEMRGCGNVVAASPIPFEKESQNLKWGFAF